MSQTYTIEELALDAENRPITKDWSNAHGSFRDYVVRFIGVDGQRIISRKLYADPATGVLTPKADKVPVRGQQLTGDFVDSTIGPPKFKEATGFQQAASTQPVQPTLPGTTPAAEEVDWDAKDCRIVHQHSQTASIQTLIALQKPFTPDDVMKLAKEYTNDVYANEHAYAGPTTKSQASEPEPVDTTDHSKTAMDDIPF